MSALFNFSLFPILTGLTLITGCGEKDVVCGGNGEMHDSHCHCDSGYVLSEDGSTCEIDNTDYGGDFIFDPSQIQASTGTNNNSQVWLLEAIDDDTHLNIEIYESYGGISSPGSLSIDETEANYATCGTCLLIKTGCVFHNDHYDCDRIFMPKPGGELQIDKIGTDAGDELSGKLLGMVFQEVTITQDYQTQPVDDGEEINLAPWEFSVQLEER